MARDYITWAEYTKDAEFRKVQKASKSSSANDKHRYIELKPEVVEEMFSSLFARMKEASTLKERVRNGTIMTEGDVLEFFRGSESERHARKVGAIEEAFLRSIAGLTEEQQQRKIIVRKCVSHVLGSALRKVVLKEASYRKAKPALKAKLRSAE